MFVKTFSKILPTFVVAVLFSGPLHEVAEAQSHSTGPNAFRSTEPSWFDQLAIAFGEAAWEEAEGSTRTWLRQQLVTPADLVKYGLVLDDNWQEKPWHLPVVVHIHGFNSTSERTAELFAPILQADYPCGYISYPNDHTLSASTELVAKHLNAFSRRHPERRLILVCHSMGGLIARGCVENPQLDPGNIDRLIMIAPPTHGSYLAHLSVGTDLWEHWLARGNGWPWERLHDSIVDGMGEAAEDLCPGSPFLCELNGRSLNPRVQYSVLLGTMGVMTEDERQWLRESAQSTIGKIPYAEECAQELDAFLCDFDEPVLGKGDGVVAVSRGRLAGVSDTVVLPFGHLKFGVLDDEHGLPLVHQEVLKRLR